MAPLSKGEDDTPLDALRRMNKIGADPMIPSVDRRQSRYQQKAQLSHMIRRAASTDLSDIEPGSRYLRPPNTALRPSSALGRSSNLSRPLSGIREASESSINERVPSSRISTSRDPSFRGPAATDGAVDGARRRSRPTRAAANMLPPSRLPERKSSRRLFQAYNARAPTLSMDAPSLVPPPPSDSGQTIRSHGQSVSPVRAVAARLDSTSSITPRPRSKTFVRTVRPSDILEFPRIRHSRVVLEMRTSTPIFVGGGTVEGQLNLVVDAGATPNCLKSKASISLGRISVDVLGVEELSGEKRWIFRSLATELIDRAHPPPTNMVVSSLPPPDAFWELVPSTSTLPFRLNLPVNMGPPPYHSKNARIRYILCSSILMKIAGQPFQVRESQDICVLSVLDPERTLINLRNPLTAHDELELPSAGETGFIKLTAGLYRQTWLSGVNIWVDVHISNTSTKTVRKMEVQLEKVTLFYDHSSASALAENTVHLRLPDRKDKQIVSNWVLKKSSRAWKGVVPKSSEVRTIEIDVPRGLVTVNTGRYFEVCYFLKVRISSTVTKLLTVQLPVTIIHPNSVDIVPNSVAQVAAAMDDTPGYSTPRPESTTPFNQGSALIAARKHSLAQLTGEPLPFKPTTRAAPQSDATSRRFRRPHSNSDPAEYLTVSNTSNRLGGDGSLERQHRRVQSSTEMNGALPRITISSKQLNGFRSADLSAFQTVGNTTLGTDGQIQRELSRAYKRSQDRGSSSGWRNIALEEAEKLSKRTQIMWM